MVSSRVVPLWINFWSFLQIFIITQVTNTALMLSTLTSRRHNLRKLGSTGPLWHWLYLSNHNHLVFIEISFSFSLPLLLGVLQGSVLGPLLVLVYVNDIPNSICKSSLLMTLKSPTLYICTSVTLLTLEMCHYSFWSFYKWQFLLLHK